jgi:hypothetical protein
MRDRARFWGRAAAGQRLADQHPLKVDVIGLGITNEVLSTLAAVVAARQDCSQV